tara:strand:- start:2729 stop:3430 length:702 start_codon:yes stop_codon:yes gene_type:complete
MAKQGKGKQVLILAAILILPSLFYVISATGKHNFVRLPFYGPKKADVSKTLKNGQPDTVYYTIPDFSYTDIEGNDLSKTSLEGKIKIFNFICAHCDKEGNRVSEQMSSVQSAVEEGKDAVLITFTVDPEKDTPSSLKQFGEGFFRNADTWHFVNAPKEKVYNFAVSDLLIGTEDGVVYKDSLLMSNQIILVDHENYIRGYFDGLQYTETKELKDAIQQLRYQMNVIEPNLKEK